MNDPHVGDLAELYALGTLDERERARVDSHIAACGRCERLVGEAEETVLALERQYTAKSVQQPALLLPRRKVPSFVPFGGAAAAGLALGLGLMFPQFQAQQQSQAAIEAMIHSHFAHAPFAPVSAGAPAAKVIYARDRAWMYVIVSGRYSYLVDAVNGTARRRLGTLHAGGDVSTLFVRAAGPATAVELTDGSHVVERAQLEPA